MAFRRHPKPMTSSWSEAGPFLAQAERDIRSGGVPVDIAGLARMWRWDEVLIRCERPVELEETPDLALRVRGALGRHLRDMALAPRRPDPWGRPPAWRTLFELEPPRGDGLELARPFVVRVDVVGDRIEVSVRLFGWSGLHVEEVGEALWNALGSGVALRPGGRFRPPFTPRSVDMARIEGVPWRDQARSVDILFDTPTVVRRGDRLSIDPASVPMAAVTRVASLAPWMECALKYDRSSLINASARLDYDMAEIRPVSWTRFSTRNPDAPIPVYAFQGRLRARGNLAPLAPWLALAETSGLGSHAALGFGRVRALLI